MRLYGVDSNDGINIAIMTGIGTYETYLSDHKHLGKVDLLNIIFE